MKQATGCWTVKSFYSARLPLTYTQSRNEVREYIIIDEMNFYISNSSNPAKPGHNNETQSVYKK